MYNVGSAVCTVHTHNATPEKFPSGSLRTLHHLASQDPGKIYKIGSTLSSLMSRTIRKTLKPPLLVPLPVKTQATRQCKHKQTKLGIQLVGITSRKLNAELHKSP